MEHQIPTIIEELYYGIVTGPDPKLWPEYLQNDPIRAHELRAFYTGLRIGLQLGPACLQED